jgi:hypothetical protein
MKLSGKTYVGSAIDLTRRFRSYLSLAHFFFNKKKMGIKKR